MNNTLENHLRRMKLSSNINNLEEAINKIGTRADFRNVESEIKKMMQTTEDNITSVLQSRKNVTNWKAFRSNLQKQTNKLTRLVQMKLKLNQVKKSIYDEEKSMKKKGKKNNRKRDEEKTKRNEQKMNIYNDDDKIKIKIPQQEDKRNKNEIDSNIKKIDLKLKKLENNLKQSQERWKEYKKHKAVVNDQVAKNKLLFNSINLIENNKTIKNMINTRRKERTNAYTPYPVTYTLTDEDLTNIGSTNNAYDLLTNNNLFNY